MSKMYSCEPFWHDFMRKDPQMSAQLQQKQFLRENVEKMKLMQTKQIEELKNALSCCEPQLQESLLKYIRYPVLFRILYNIYLTTKNNSTAFSETLNQNPSIKTLLDYLNQESSEDPDIAAKVENKWNEICESASIHSSAEYNAKENKRTWRDMPPEDLADRLSKGEIMPRDEWIPGISGGKKCLDLESSSAYIDLAKQMQQDGRTSFQKGDFEFAFVRFTQGVQLLNWVETSSENQQELKDLYHIHLRNQAVAAFKCKKYNDSIKACTTILQEIDEHDGKARYRRAKAYLEIGLTNTAKDDYVAVLKSPYADQGSVSACRAGLRELRQIVIKCTQKTKKTFLNSLEKSIFAHDNDESINLSPSLDPSDHQENAMITNLGKYQKCEEPDPFLDLEKTTLLLEELLDVYTSDENRKKLIELRKQADYEERRILLRCRTFLPQLQEPILKKYGFNEKSMGDNVKKMEQCVAFWKKRDENVLQLASECMASLLGENWDE